MELQEFGKELRNMRKEMHMTQEKLAEFLDTDAVQISKYEKGIREMGALMYAKFLKLHAENEQKRNDVLTEKIRKLSDSDQQMIEQLVARLEKG